MMTLGDAAGMTLGDAAGAGGPSMSHPLSRIGLLVLSGLVALPLRAAPPSPLSEAQLAARIDSLIAAHWKKEGIAPAPVTDDAAFIRRAFLDLAGRIPSILEVRDFL